MELTASTNFKTFQDLYSLIYQNFLIYPYIISI